MNAKKKTSKKSIPAKGLKPQASSPKPAKPLSVSQAVREAVNRSGLSLYAIAKSAEIEYGTLHRFVHADADVRVSSIDALAKTLGLELVQRV